MKVRPQSGFCFQCLAVALLLAGEQAAFSADDLSPIDRLRTLQPPHRLRSHSGRFRITGTNSAENLELLKWAEEISRRIERTTGLKMTFGPEREFHILVDQRAATNSVRVDIIQDAAPRRFYQSLLIGDYIAADPAAANEALCRLFLNGYVFACPVTNLIASASVNSPEAASVTNPPPPALPAWKDPVPAWLSEGLAQHVFQERRDAGAEIALAQWRQGRIGTLSGFLRAEPDRTNATFRAVSCMFIGWLQSQPDKADVFKALFLRMAERQPLTPEWLATVIPSSKSLADFEVKWENWLISQWRVVHKPGKVTPTVLEHLRAQLCVRAGDPGMPPTTNLNWRAALSGLIAEKDAPWIPDVCAAKSAQFRLLGVGRGPEFANVIDAYIRFLDALRRRKNADRLEELLDEADTLFEALEASTMKGSPP